MRPSHMYVRLVRLIASSGIEQGDAFRRLNAIENQLTNLQSVALFAPDGPRARAAPVRSNPRCVGAVAGSVDLTSPHMLERLVI